MNLHMADIAYRPESCGGARLTLTATSPPAARSVGQQGSTAYVGNGTTGKPMLLRALATERDWQKLTILEQDFRRTMREFSGQSEPDLAKVTVSSRQFELCGNIRRL